MTTQRFGIALTVVNLFLLAIVLAHVSRPALADETPAMLRGRGLEIVDAQGRVRASISVYPAEKAAGQTSAPETVLLRLMTERGRPAVKISTSEGDGSGMTVAGPTGTSQTFISMGAKGTATTLTLKNEDGTQRVVVP